MASRICIIRNKCKGQDVSLHAMEGTLMKDRADSMPMLLGLQIWISTEAAGPHGK